MILTALGPYSPTCAGCGPHDEFYRPWREANGSGVSTAACRASAERTRQDEGVSGIVVRLEGGGLVSAARGGGNCNA